MKELPILFSTEMVQALLDGRKTQTRRVITAHNTVGFSIKKKLLDFGRIEIDRPGVIVCEESSDDGWYGHCKYQPGDLLYVRETWKPLGQDPDDGQWTIEYKDGTKLNIGRMWPKEEEPKEIDLSERLAEQYEEKGHMPWKPSIHMPKNASRIWLRVKKIWPEHIQDISDADIKKEGIDWYETTAIERLNKFESLWDSINKSRGYGWDNNPLVWATEFEIVSETGKPEL